jgi:biotin transport system substrate-specific component
MENIKIKLIQKSLTYPLGFCLILSWVYAVASQCCIPLPFNPIPLTMQSITLIFCAWLFGKTAVHAYCLYLLQGLIGLPFFSHFGSGITHLLGPTGGYLVGFFFAMIFMSATKNILGHSNLALFVKYCLACLIYYLFGLAQLALFVPAEKILIIGFYPFFISDFGIKAFFMLFLASRFKR